MAAQKHTNHLLSAPQFSGATYKKDPHAQDYNQVRFTGAEGSKTMVIARGHLPHPPSKHPHHRKAGRRSHRAK